MNDSADVGDLAPAKSYRRDFWIKENRKHIPAHYRLRKTARVVNGIAGGRACDLLDVGCGPATLARLLQGGIRYYGIDLAIQEPAPNLLETDILDNRIRFGDQRFDIVVAQGLFEYLGHAQSQKFAEIAESLTQRGRFVVTYTNFGHRDKHVFEAFSNVRPVEDFRRDLDRHFTVHRCFPTSYNWHGGQPARGLLQAVNMPLQVNVPVVGPWLAVEYFFVCSAR